MTSSAISAATFVRILEEGMPSAASLPLEVVTLERGRAVLRVRTGPADVRPGATLAGPLLFAVADLAAYAAVLSVVGEVPLAVTTDATIHFLRRPSVATLEARARVIKSGSRLIVLDVEVAQDDQPDAVAHAVMTYSVPPRR